MKTDPKLICDRCKADITQVYNNACHGKLGTIRIDLCYSCLREVYLVIWGTDIGTGKPSSALAQLTASLEHLGLDLL